MSRAESRIDIREDLAPLYVISFTGVANDEQFDQYLERLTLISMRHERRALIYDATACGPTPPSHRKKQAEWMKRYDERTRATVVGCAFVLPSTLMRGVLTAIFWVQPMACPHAVVGTLGEAIVWCRERLEKGVGRESLRA